MRPSLLVALFFVGGLFLPAGSLVAQAGEIVVNRPVRYTIVQEWSDTLAVGDASRWEGAPRVEVVRAKRSCYGHGCGVRPQRPRVALRLNGGDEVVFIPGIHPWGRFLIVVGEPHLVGSGGGAVAVFLRVLAVEDPRIF